MKEQSKEERGIQGTMEFKKAGGMNTKETFS